MLSNLQKLIANHAILNKTPVQESTTKTVPMRHRFNKDSFRDKMTLDLTALSVFDNQVRAVHENITSAYENLKGICEELDVTVGESSMKLLYATNSKANIQESFKRKLHSHLDVNFIRPFNSGKIVDERQSEVENIVESIAKTENSTYKEGLEDVLTYAIFEQTVIDFVKNLIVRPELDDYIQESIKSTRQDYFDTFENNFKDKYEELLEQVATIGIEIAPILYERVESVVGEKPNKVIKGVSKLMKQR
jgi:hypothetical protein